MAVSNTPDPLPEKPTAQEIDAIASRTFSTSFRGWDQDEVRVHLVQIADTVRSMAQRQFEIERRLAEAEAAARRADVSSLDPDDVATVLGEETARVLRTARESAAEIQSKAEERVALLTRQASEAAAQTRAAATAEAEALRREARQEADATRAAGQSYVEDLKADAQAGIAQKADVAESEAAALLQRARDDAAQLTVDADDKAAKVVGDAEDQAATMVREAEDQAALSRANADSYVTARRAEADDAAAAVIAEANEQAKQAREAASHHAEALIAEAQAELDRANAQAEERIAEAERVRERLLGDLARKRKSARQHLEQLRAGRDRLLEAFEVVRTTTDSATRELDVVLPDAKRVADDAARRVAAEPDQSIEELEAELTMAREAGLPWIVPGPDDVADDADADADADAADAAEAHAFDDAEANDDAGADDEVAEGVDDAGDVADPAGDVAGNNVSASAPLEAPAAAQADAINPADHAGLKSRRRTKKQAVETQESAAESKLEPVVLGDEFEAVRVFDSGEVPVVSVDDDVQETSGEVPAVTIAAQTAESRALDESGVRVLGGASPKPKPATADPTPAKDEAADHATDDRAEETATSKSPGKQAVPKTGAEAALAAVASQQASQPSAAREAEDVKAQTAAPPTVSPDVSTPDDGNVDDAPDSLKSGDAAGNADVDQIFARLREERDGSAESASRPDEPVAADDANGAADAARDAVSANEQDEPSDEATTDEPVKSADEPADESTDESTDESADEPDGQPVDATLASWFARRDADISDVARRLAKRLKRVLSDEQSDLLDALRRAKPADANATLLPARDVHEAGFVAAALTDLPGAVVAGTRFAGDLHDDASAHADFALDDIAAELASAISTPLLGRLERALGDSSAAVDPEAATTDSGDELALADRIRSCYREWRGDRLTDLATDACASAYFGGMRAALPDAVALVWKVDHGADPCADCADNELAGAVEVGSVFPTGQMLPPAHPDCSCLVLPEGFSPAS